MIHGMNSSEKLNKWRSRRSADVDVETPKFYKLDPPTGRSLYVELGVVVDKVISLVNLHVMEG